MKRKCAFMTAMIVLMLLSSSCISDAAQKESDDQGFVKLFNGKNFDGWYLKIKSGDAELAKKVYAIEDSMVHVFKDFPDEFELGTGKNDTHGLFYTKKKYSKYIFRFEYKWGTKIGNNFARWQYDAGCYYHVYDDKIWPKGIEYQVRYDHTKDKNHTGDFITANTSVRWFADKENETFLLPKDGGTDMGQREHKILACSADAKHNALNDKWNQCEIIVMGDQYSIHKLNGEIVNMGTELSHSEGIIGLQSETCEIYYRNIEIKEFDEIIPIEEFLGEPLYPSLSSYQWQTLDCTGAPVARHEAAFVEAKGEFYLLGGRRIQEVSIFDPATSTWTSGAKPPVELHHFQGFSYKGKIHVVGVQSGKYPREDSLTETYTYDPDTDTWAKGFTMPTDRVRGSTTASVYKDKLYIAGGIIDGHWDGHVKWFDCYDFKTGKWETLPDIPRFRDHACSVVCNDKLYLLGGRVTSGKIKKVFELTVPEVDVYDFKTGKWSTLDAPVPTQRAGCTAVCIQDKILFAGGESAAQTQAHSEIECLDTQTGTWSQLALVNQGRHGTQLIWHEHKLYIASGCGNRGGNPELKTIECFKAL